MPFSVLLFGASGSIGSAIKRSLELRGLAVDCPGRDLCDLSNDSSIDSYLSNLNYIPHGLVLAHGVNNPLAIEETTKADWDLAFQINFWASLKIMSFISSRQATLKRGSTVVLSSLYSMKSRHGRAPYSASKAALDSAVKSFAVEFASKNLRFNSVHPGFIDTELTRMNNSAEEIMKIESRIPESRLGLSEEVAEAVCFLISDNSSYVNGTTIIVDGGYSAQG